MTTHLDLVLPLLLLPSLALLYYGANWLVDGATSLAKHMGVSPMVIGLTIVAFGTSSPELETSILAALEAKPNIALGNIVGSNIFNIAFILGLASMVRPLKAQARIVRIDIPIMLVSVLLLVLLSTDGSLSPLDGIIFLSGISLYTYFQFRLGKKESVRMPELVDEYQKFLKGHKRTRTVTLVISGLLMVGGGELLITSAVAIAGMFDISEKTIAITMVAGGTGLPEIFTSILAVKKGKTDIAIGNAVGSNIFNTLSVVGVASNITPIAVGSSFYFDYVVLLLITAALLPLAKSGFSLARWEGTVLFVAYLSYVSWLFYIK